MQFSTDLPHGAKAIAEYLASGQALRMNVSREADAAFMRELQDHDPQRYARLQKKMFNVGGKSGWTVGQCSRCQGPIHDAPFVSKVEPGEFCSRACRDAIKESLRGSGSVRCEHCGLLLPADARKGQRYCDSTCRRNAKPSRRGSQIPAAPIGSLGLPERLGQTPGFTRVFDGS